MPLIEPRATTPAVVTSDRPNSRWSIRQNWRRLAMSNSERAAAISTTPRAATGTNCSGPVNTSSTTAMVAAATNPVTCVLPPAVTAMAVRESAPVTTKPWVNEEAMLAAP